MLTAKSHLAPKRSIRWPVKGWRNPLTQRLIATTNEIVPRSQCRSAMMALKKIPQRGARAHGHEADEADGDENHPAVRLLLLVLLHLSHVPSARSVATLCAALP